MPTQPVGQGSAVIPEHYTRSEVVLMRTMHTVTAPAPTGHPLLRSPAALILDEHPVKLL